MPFSFRALTEGVCETASGSKFLCRLSVNPFAAALTITAILMATVMFVFRRATLPADQSLWSMMLRTGLYSFGGTLVVVWLHHSYMSQAFEAKGAAYGGGMVPMISSTLTGTAPTTVDGVEYHPAEPEFAPAAISFI